MQFMTEGDPLSTSIPRPHAVEGLQRAILRLLQLAGIRTVTHDERMQHAIAALEHLANLAEHPGKYSFYDLLRQQEEIEHGLKSSVVASKTVRVLGLFGSPSAQRILVNYASQSTRALTERQAAAAAFDVAVQRRGLLLARDEILRQYDRYNQGAVLDRDTQQVLGSLLDSIEAPTRVDEAAAEADQAEEKQGPSS